MDIKYNVSKYKDSKIQELKDSVSIEEPLEMRLKFKKNGKWETQNISITMRTPGNDEDLIRGFLFNERIIENLNQIETTEQKGDDVGDYNLKNTIEATINNIENLDIERLKRNFLTNSSCVASISRTTSYKLRSAYSTIQFRRLPISKIRRRSI